MKDEYRNFVNQVRTIIHDLLIKYAFQFKGRENFSTFNPRDVELAFRLYDHMIFGGRIQKKLIDDHADVIFTISGHESLVTKQSDEEYIFNVSPTPMKRVHRGKKVYNAEGDEIVCSDRVFCLQFIMEHQIIHLLMLIYEYQNKNKKMPLVYSVHGKLYECMLYHYFGLGSSLDHDLGLVKTVGREMESYSFDRVPSRLQTLPEEKKVTSELPSEELISEWPVEERQTSSRLSVPSEELLIDLPEPSKEPLILPEQSSEELILDWPIEEQQTPSRLSVSSEELSIDVPPPLEKMYRDSLVLPKMGILRNWENSCYMDSLLMIILVGDGSLYMKQRIFDANLDAFDYPTQFCQGSQIQEPSQYRDIAEKLRTELFDLDRQISSGYQVKCVDIRNLLAVCYPDMRNTSGYVMYNPVRLYSLLTDLFPSLYMYNLPTMDIEHGKMVRTIDHRVSAIPFSYFDTERYHPHNYIWDEVDTPYLVFYNELFQDYDPSKLFGEYILNRRYRLWGSVVAEGVVPTHYGQEGGGHYTSFIRINNRWVHYDDMKQQLEQLDEFPTEAVQKSFKGVPELLFYEKRGISGTAPQRSIKEYKTDLGKYTIRASDDDHTFICFEDYSGGFVSKDVMNNLPPPTNYMGKWCWNVINENALGITIPLHDYIEFNDYEEYETPLGKAMMRKIDTNEYYVVVQDYSDEVQNRIEELGDYHLVNETYRFVIKDSAVNIRNKLKKLINYEVD